MFFITEVTANACIKMEIHDTVSVFDFKCLVLSDQQSTTQRDSANNGIKQGSTPTAHIGDPHPRKKCQPRQQNATSILISLLLLLLFILFFLLYNA